MTSLQKCFYLEDHGHTADAEKVYLSILADTPNNPDALHNLGRLYYKNNMLDRAIGVFKHLVSVVENPQSLTDLCHLLLDAGHTVDSVKHFPNPSDKLMASCHLQDHAHCDMLHKEWGNKYTLNTKPKGNGRIGFVSPDFKKSTVMDFFLPVVSKDHYCYYDGTKQDHITTKVQDRCGKFMDVSRLSDTQLAEQLELDGIDITVDLAGNFDRKRRDYFGNHQSYNYIRYVHGTGSPNSIRVTDSIIDPVDTDERIVRVDGCCFGYQGNPDVPVKAQHSGPKKYGSLNRPAKFTPELFQAWSDILKIDKDALLFVLCPSGGGSKSLRQRMVDSGIPAERLHLVANGNHYHRFVSSMDVILDSFAYSGVTTTCDALWAGVPVVTMAGISPQNRIGASLLTAAGQASFIADSISDYILLAGETATSDGVSLRRQVRQSPLVDGSIKERLIKAL